MSQDAMQYRFRILQNVMQPMNYEFRRIQNLFVLKNKIVFFFLRDDLYETMKLTRRRHVLSVYHQQTRTGIGSPCGLRARRGPTKLERSLPPPSNPKPPRREARAGPGPTACPPARARATPSGRPLVQRASRRAVSPFSFCNSTSLVWLHFFSKVGGRRYKSGGARA